MRVHMTPAEKNAVLAMIILGTVDANANGGAATCAQQSCFS